MMSDILSLLEQTHQRLINANKQMPNVISEELLSNLANAVDALTQQKSGAYEQAQDTIAQMAQYYPQLVPAIDRKLLWLLGGNCLHILTDEEIQSFQAQDD